jgi:hypothetical protein
VKGSGGVPATVVVTVQRGHVGVSIQPPFTWEAIMDPEKVDELIGTLAQAQEVAREQSRDSPEVASLPVYHRRTGARRAVAVRSHDIPRSTSSPASLRHHRLLLRWCRKLASPAYGQRRCWGRA